MINNSDYKPRTNAQAAGQIPWWRNVYNRLSQTGHEPDEEEKQPFRRKTLSRLRSDRNRRIGTKIPPQQIAEQVPFDALNSRPSEGTVCEEHDAIQPQFFCRDRHVNDLHGASQWRYDDGSESIPEPGPSSVRDLRSPSLGPGTAVPLPKQALRGPPFIFHNSENGPMSPPPDNVPTAQRTPYQGSSGGQARASTQKHDTQHNSCNQTVYTSFAWDPPPKDVDSGGPNTSPVEPQHSSALRSEETSMPHDRHINTWLYSTPPRK